MQDEVESQLSAMFDGELPAAECELLSRRLDRDEALRARWSRYALIGAAMRSEPVATARTGFAQRVSAAIEFGSSIPHTQPSAARRRLRRGNLVWSGALAATLVAGVAGLGVSMLRDAALNRAASPTPLMTAISAPAALTPNSAMETGAAVRTFGGPLKVANRSSNSYVTPAGTPGVSTVLRSQLADYIVAHSEYSPPLLRRSVQSELLTSEDQMGIASSFAGAAGMSQGTVAGGGDAIRFSSDVRH